MDSIKVADLTCRHSEPGGEQRCGEPASVVYATATANMFAPLGANLTLTGACSEHDGQGMGDYLVFAPQARIVLAPVSHYAPARA